MVTKTNKTAEKDAQKEEAITTRVFLGGPIPLIDGHACQVKLFPAILAKSGISPRDEVELIATESGIFIKKTGKAALNSEPPMKAPQRNPVVEALMEDQKFQQRVQRGELNDEELDLLEADEKAAEAKEAEREDAAAWGGPHNSRN